MRSTPALPLLPFTCRNASFRFARSHTSSKIRLVLAGRSGSLTTESDSMSSRPACRASPVGADEKSSLNWIFSRLSLSRFMSYLPLLSFGPSAIVSGSAYLLTPPFGDGVPCRRHGPLCPLLTSALRSDRLTAPSVAEATQSRSPGVSSVAFRAQSPGLRFASLMDMDFAVSGPLVRRLRLVPDVCPSTRTFAIRFLQTSPRGDSPCVVANPSPPSGWVEDFHLQATEHAQHTTKSLRDSPLKRGLTRGRGNQ